MSSPGLRFGSLLSAVMMLTVSACEVASSDGTDAEAATQMAGDARVDGALALRPDVSTDANAQAEAGADAQLAAPDAELHDDAQTMADASEDASQDAGNTLGPGYGLLSGSELTPHALAADATHLYWATGYELHTPATLRRVALATGEIETLVTLTATGTLSSDAIYSVLLDETHVYWTQVDAGGGRLMSLAKSGGQPRELRAHPYVFMRMVMDADNFYLDEHVSYQEHAVYKLSRRDGSFSKLADSVDQLGAMAVDGTHVYWGTFDSNGPTSLHGSIVRVPIAGGIAQTLASQQGNVTSVALHGDSIYWSAHQRGELRKMAKSGGPVSLVLDGLYDAESLQIVGEHLYFGSSADEAPRTMPVAGGAVSSYTFSGNGYPRDLLVTDQHLFWSASAGHFRDYLYWLAR